MAQNTKSPDTIKIPSSVGELILFVENEKVVSIAGTSSKNKKELFENLLQLKANDAKSQIKLEIAKFKKELLSKIF